MPDERADRGGSAKPDGRPAVRILGWVLMAVGLLLVVYGALPLRTALDIMGQEPNSATGDQMDAIIAELKDRMWADIVGFGLLIVGAVFDAAGKRPGREVLDDRIKAALDARDRERASPRQDGEGRP